MPFESPQLEYYLMKTGHYFIAKPSNGRQGDGILLIKNKQDLLTWKARPIEEMVVQEYVHRPLLLYGRKFDLRLYVVITSIDPFIVFMNTEGLARFCTEKYQDPSPLNIGNSCIHITNYSLNKRNLNFIPTDELYLPNHGTKQTLKSLYSTLAAEGYNTELIKNRVKAVVAKTLAAIQPSLVYLYRSQCRREVVSGFQIIGVDVLLDWQGQPWLLEINANPSVRIDCETEGTVCMVDYYVKTKVVEDAIRLAQHPPGVQLDLQEFFSYEKLLPSGQEFTDKVGVLMAVRSVFDRIAVENLVSAPAFRGLYSFLHGVNPSFMRAGLDHIFKAVTKKSDARQLDLLSFTSALIELSAKVLPKAPLAEGLASVVEALNLE